MLLLLTLRPAFVHAQAQADSLLRRAELTGIDFYNRQDAFHSWKQQERRRVPVYNARLNGVLIDFHKHISKDDHYLATNCGICRKYLHEIKSYSKKLEQAMK